MHGKGGCVEGSALFNRGPADVHFQLPNLNFQYITRTIHEGAPGTAGLTVRDPAAP